MSEIPTELQLNLMRRFNSSDALHRSARRYPNKAVVLFEDQKVTYTALDKLANKAAHMFLRAGLKRGDRIAVLALNSPEFLAIWMGAARIGVILAPVNVGLDAASVHYILEKSAAQAVIVETAFLPFLKNYPLLARITSKIVIGAATDGFQRFDDLIKESADNYPEVYVASDDPCTLLYTSGTESKPKGVLNSHSNWYAALISALGDAGFSREDRVLLSVPLFHAAGLFVSFSTLAAGGTMFMTRRVDIPQILAGIPKHRVTKMLFPATVFLGLLQVPGIEKVDLSSIERWMVFQYMPSSAMRRWAAIVPHAKWTTFWGQSELTPIGSSLIVNDPTKIDEYLVAPDPIGLPHIPNAVRIVDENDNDVAPGETGQIVVRSPSVMLGYLDDKERTAQTFRNGWHHTGDMARQDEHGNLYFMDRTKDMIKSGGENVSSQEVEETIAACPGVAEVAVIGIDDPYWVEAVMAVVTARADSNLKADQVLAYCKERLAGFKVPKRVEIVEALPKNPTGKILKQVLRKQYKTPE